MYQFGVPFIRGKTTEWSKMKKLYIDIETAPNVSMTWGLFNQNVSLDQIVESGYTLCWAAKWEHEKTVMFSSVHGDGAKKMLKQVHDLLCEADVVVHYNGTNFDMPILNKEFVKYGLLPPTPYQQVDLLRTVRRRFRFTSNKLDYVAEFLGLGNKLPHKGMSLWVGCMHGDESAWRIMERYNKQDVKLLPKLYHVLLPWIQNHPNMGLYSEVLDKDGNHVEQCPNCGSTHLVKNGMEHLATQSYQRFKCAECGTPLRGRTTALPKEKRKAVIVASKL